MISLKETYKIEFQGLVWNTDLDTSNGVFVIEYREELHKKPTFLCINGYTGERINELDIIDNNSWRVGLEKVINNKVFLHEFADDNKPHHTQFHCYDVSTGNFLWSKQGTIINFSKDNTLKMVDEHNRELILSIDNGEVSDVYNEDWFNGGIINPVHYTEEDKHFHIVATFIKSELGTIPAKALDYLETENEIIISFYIYEGARFTNHLWVLNKEGGFLLKDIIGKALTGIGIHTFFVFNNSLNYIKNKTTLCSKALT